MVNESFRRRERTRIHVVAQETLKGSPCLAGGVIKQERSHAITDRTHVLCEQQPVGK
jgi:hypothetical protein